MLRRFRPAAEPLEPRYAPNAAPLTPPVTEPATDGRVLNGADVHMEAGPFSDPDVGDTHTATEWEIWTAGGTPQRVWRAAPTQPGAGALLIHIHLGDGSFEGPLAGRSELTPDTNYTLRVRFRDSSGQAATQWSPWSQRSFRTAALTQVQQLETDDIASTPAPSWSASAGGNLLLPPAAALNVEASGQLLLRIAGSAGGNVVTNPPALAAHGPVRVRVQAPAGAGLILPESDLTFTDHEGHEQTIYLPAVSLNAGQQAYFWVSVNGSTYAGNASQTQPNFSTLARGATVPWLVRQPGYRVEVVASGFQLPVNIAFVPNPGSQPTDPLYYVTELYGAIKVVRRDGTVGDYATGLLNFNPTGAFPGSGEQGVTGIVVDPATGDVFASMVYSQVPFDDNSPHFPRVVRFHSNDGGLTAASQGIVLDMPGETQGASHQISNLSFGPDGKLYVHNGDGFDANTALNLNSFRGKLLRVNLGGTAPSDNPFYNAADGITARDYVYAYGLRNPFGGAWRAADGKHYEVENGPSVDRFARVERGASYGYNGTDASMRTSALYNWDPARAPVNMAFVQPATFGGSGFPAARQDHAFVTLSGGTWGTGPSPNAKRIVEFAFDAVGNALSPTTLVEYTGSGKATAAGLAAGPDGLYFTDLYKDLDYSTPIDRGANVLRVRYVGIADFVADVRSGEEPLTVQFTDLSDVPGATGWLWDFGDGTTSSARNPTHTFTGNGPYDIVLSVTGVGGVVTTSKPAYVVVGDEPEGLTATYHDNIDFTGATVTRTDATVNFEWGQGSPASGIGADTFAVRWTGQVWPRYSQTYTFYTTSDDGVRLWVNGQQLINNWTNHGRTVDTGTIALVAGQRYDIRMEYYDNGGNAVAILEWSSASQAREVVPQSRLFTAAGADAPAAPTGLTATPAGPGQVELAWTDNATDETGYRVERSVNGAAFVPVAVLGANAVRFSDGGLAAGTLHQYRVRAVGPSGVSAFSNTATVTTTPLPTIPNTALPVLPGATDITPQVRVVRGPVVAVRRGRWRRTLTLRNVSGRSIPSRVVLLLTDVPPEVQVLRGRSEGAGRWSLVVPLRSDVFRRREQRTVVLDFSSPSGSPFRFGLRVLRVNPGVDGV